MLARMLKTSHLYVVVWTITQLLVTLMASDTTQDVVTALAIGVPFQNFF